jgi:hypothetical protein
MRRSPQVTLHFVLLVPDTCPGPLTVEWVTISVYCYESDSVFIGVIHAFPIFRKPWRSLRETFSVDHLLDSA